MANKRYPRILYFIKGVMPSAEAVEVAEQYGPNVAFRNANFASSAGAPEKCDGVAGDIPEAYAKLPKAKDALKDFEEKRKAAAEKAKANAEKRAEEKAKAEEEAKKKADEEAKKAAQTGKQPAKAQQAKTTSANANKPADWKPNA